MKLQHIFGYEEEKKGECHIHGNTGKMHAFTRVRNRSRMAQIEAYYLAHVSGLEMFSSSVCQHLLL